MSPSNRSLAAAASARRPSPLKKTPNPGVITVKLSAGELKLLAALASDQLFRREFIDPKMPGYKTNPAEVSLGKSLVARLQSLINPDQTRRTPAPRIVI